MGKKRDMSEPNAATAPSARSSKAKRAAWDQQPGENDLWYARFARFVALGPTRSVSLVAKGRRNAYPVPAHWPIQSKQMNWRERATAFDEAAAKDPTLIVVFNNLLLALSTTAENGEVSALDAAVKAGGYHAPPTDEDEDEPTPTNTNTN